MKYPMQKILLAGVLLVATAAIAKLPAVSDEAKAKAAEAAAKTAWSGKVEGFPDSRCGLTNGLRCPNC